MANKRSKGQLALLKLIQNKRNLPNKDEVFDIYVDLVCKEKCSIVGNFGNTWYHERDVKNLEEISFTWYRSALGSLIIKGEINLVL